MLLKKLLFIKSYTNTIKIDYNSIKIDYNLRVLGLTKKYGSIYKSNKAGSKTRKQASRRLILHN